MILNSEKKPREKRAKTPEEKLKKRITSEFKGCRYIGDINISDEEYEMLIKHFKKVFVNMVKNPDIIFSDCVFAVALVQIGIRYYDGSFWSHVKRELGVEKLDGIRQRLIGRNFYCTLTEYNKYHVAENELVNNILMHCFITQYYADDLFDFLFAYYSIDLDRDLKRNNKEMRNYLMQSMEKGDSSSRAYKIKKHTADAVVANEKGCKIRVGKILRFIDNALFYDIYPTSSQNRVAKLFCAWTEKSKKFKNEKKSTRGISRNGAKNFKTPYVHFNGKDNQFNIILPQQYIRIDENEELPEISWKIVVNGKEQIIDAYVESCVTGCKTSKIDNAFLSSDDLFEEIKIELYKNNNERLKQYKINSDSARFFDDDWDIIDSLSYAKYLPEGDIFAFTRRGDELHSESDVFMLKEIKFGFNLYTLNLKKGDVLRLPNGKAKSVGRPLEEGIVSASVVSGAYVIDKEKKYSLYSKFPSIFFRMRPEQEAGTFISIKGENTNIKKRLEVDKCLKFDIDGELLEKGYIINIEKYISENGIFEITVDVPNSKKERTYSIAVIRDFGFEYDSAPYIFKEKGEIIFLSGNSMICEDSFVSAEENKFSFPILPDIDYLSFIYIGEKSNIRIRIYIPALKWKFDDGEWNVAQSEEIWHKEFPKTIWIKYPDEKISFSMDPIISETDETEEKEDEEQEYKISFSKQNHMFCCDTRKMLSWFGKEDPKRYLYIDFENRKEIFALIVTKCFAIGGVEIEPNYKNSKLEFKTNIAGFSQCFADVYLEGKLIGEKQPITSKGIKINAPINSGNYKIVFYEMEEDDEEEFDFGEYNKFYESEIMFVDEYDLTGKTVTVDAAVKPDEKTVFAPERYDMKEKFKISISERDETDSACYYGYALINEVSVKVWLKITGGQFVNTKKKKAEIMFYNEEEEGYLDFIYDNRLKFVCLEEDYNMPLKNYILLDNQFYYEITVK